jgi:hypothetical protein
MEALLRMQSNDPDFVDGSILRTADGWFTIGRSLWWIHPPSGRSVKVAPTWHADGWSVVERNGATHITTAEHLLPFGQAMARASALRQAILDEKKAEP